MCSVSSSPFLLISLSVSHMYHVLEWLHMACSSLPHLFPLTTNEGRQIGSNSNEDEQLGKETMGICVGPLLNHWPCLVSKNANPECWTDVTFAGLGYL